MRISTLLLLCLALISCSKKPPEKKDLPNLSQIELAEAAVSVDKSLDTLSELSAERAILQVQPQTREQLDYGMYQLASVDWVGPGEPLIKQLAQAAGYHVRTIGKAPVYSGLVAIDKRQVAIGELLRDVALQMEHTADVVVFPKSKLIEIRYL